MAYISYAIYEFIEALKDTKTIVNNYCLLCISIEDSKKSSLVVLKSVGLQRRLVICMLNVSQAIVSHSQAGKMWENS